MESNAPKQSIKGKCNVYSDLCTGLFNAFFHRYGYSFQQFLQLQLLLLRHIVTFQELNYVGYYCMLSV